MPGEVIDFASKRKELRHVTTYTANLVKVIVNPEKEMDKLAKNSTIRAIHDSMKFDFEQIDGRLDIMSKNPEQFENTSLIGDHLDAIKESLIELLEVIK